ncbi:MAG: S1 RNA-binding domain-containing protein, partial [Azovibrio sp.]
LSYEHYTHFTSPIRRYPDLLVHRAIKAVLAGERYNPGPWEVIGLHCSQTERRADEATRDVQNWLKCYYMRGRIGEVFDGTISAVTAFGIFVALDQVYVEGLVHVSDLGTDYFQFDPIKHQMLGERTGQRFRLGDRVRVKLVRADLETNKIDFTLVAFDAAGGAVRRERSGAGQAAKQVSRQTTSGKTAARPESVCGKAVKAPQKTAQKKTASRTGAGKSTRASKPAASKAGGVKAVKVKTTGNTGKSKKK